MYIYLLLLCYIWRQFHYKKLLNRTIGLMDICRGDTCRSWSMSMNNLDTGMNFKSDTEPKSNMEYDGFFHQVV